jgi:hypothetical protein
MVLNDLKNEGLIPRDVPFSTMRKRSRKNSVGPLGKNGLNRDDMSISNISPSHLTKHDASARMLPSLPMSPSMSSIQTMPSAAVIGMSGSNLHQQQRI